MEDQDASRGRKDPVRNSAEDADHADVAASPPCMFLSVVGAGFLLNRLFPLGILGDSGAVGKALGVTLLAAAGVIQVPTVLLMLRAKTALRPDRATTTLITRGFFRYSRNPLYVSLMLIQSAVAVYCNLLWLVILLPILFVALDRCVVLREEEYLERRFGEDYLEYKKKVRRWIGFGRGRKGS